MHITQITYQKKDPSRVNLYIDGSFFCGISTDILARFNLYEGKDIDNEVLQSVLYEDLYFRFFNRVVDNLAKSPKTEFQIRKYLNEVRFKKKGIWYEEDMGIDWDVLFNNVVSKLKEYKYIDDESYARSFVSSRVRNKPRGKNILIGELLSKGVDKDIAVSVCEDLVKEEYELLVEVFNKKYKGKRLDIRDSKMVGYLMRKGFSWDLIERLSKDEFTE